MRGGGLEEFVRRGRESGQSGWPRGITSAAARDFASFPDLGYTGTRI